jgi:hypothetical protein
VDITPDGQTHLDELSERMDWLEQQPFDKRLVHVIDREADSAAHMRQWSARGQHWLVRVKAASSVCFDRLLIRASEMVERDICLNFCPIRLDLPVCSAFPRIKHAPSKI